MDKGAKSRVKILDVILMNEIKGNVSDEFHSIPLYEYVEPGVIKENPGRRKSHDDILLYDVSNQSPEFKERYAAFIRELEVSSIIKISKGKKESTPSAGRIITVLPLDGKYAKLSTKEADPLGHDFVSITAKEGGFEVKPLLVSKMMPDNIYLKVTPENLSDDLIAKLSSDMTELVQKENGLYESRGNLQKDKNFS